MNAVGIDISKRSSMVAVLRPYGEVVFKPFKVSHEREAVEALISQLQSLEGETRIVMEHTGRYYEPMAKSLSNAGFFVSPVNPKLIKDFGSPKLHDVKTDKADAVKIARFTLDNWPNLRQYTGMDTTRENLKIMNRQFAFYTKQKTAAKNNLIALLDQTYPGVNRLFQSPARADGSQKWVDFVSSFWHADCVLGSDISGFTERYRKWCKRYGYNFQAAKPAEIYEAAKKLIPVLPKDVVTKSLVMQSVEQVNSLSRIVEGLRIQMNELAATIPEYPVVMGLRGVGTSLGPQLMAEIGDITRFTRRNGLTAYAGVDPKNNQSGEYEARSVHTTKKGSPYLRRTLFQVMECLIKTAPYGDPVFDYMDKLRKRGKPYFVYMTAGANKLLRIYYGRVKEYLATLEE